MQSSVSLSVQCDKTAKPEIITKFYATSADDACVRQVLSVVAGETIKNSTVLDHAMLQALNPIFKIPDCMKKLP